MHDPMSVAFEIKGLFKTNGYRLPLITIWHVDPETDGTDDSCGWFMRARHGNSKILEEIKREFDFNFKHNYWFDKNGKQIFSTIGTLVQMYQHATWIYFDRNRNKQRRFMKKYLYDIIDFAENPVDCAGDNITNKWNCTSSDRFNSFASMIYSDILRKERKWYQHPKYHFWHWKVQFNFLQGLFKKKEKSCCVVDEHLRETV